MLDPFLTPAFFVHFLTLLGLWIGFVKKWEVPARDKPFFVVLFLWATIVLTGHLASFGRHLGDLAVYVPVSFLSAVFLLSFFAFVHKAPMRPAFCKKPSLSFTSLGSKKTERFLFLFLAITLGLFALASLVLGLSVYPDNADSMIYRLPRAFWYVSHGSFLHPFESLDKRLVFYPLNGVALYVPLVLYGLPGTAHALPSLLSWGGITYATFCFARDLGARKTPAFFTAWLIGLTPSILAQATSTNDEILAAAALLSCLYLGWRWLRTGLPLYFVSSCLALALSAGTKLHIVFLLPIVGLAFLSGALCFFRNPKSLSKGLKSLDPKTTIAGLFILAGFFLPFLFYNYASTGRFYFLGDFKNDVFNLSASLKGGFQNILIYTSQMLFSPIADLNFWPVANDRQVFNTALNRFFHPFIASLVDPSPSFYHLSYRFVGITLPVSVRFVEFSLWSGFVWLLWPLQVVLIGRQKGLPLRSLFLLMALTPPLWLIFWSFSTLYMEGTATYFTFYLICAAPAVVFVFSEIRSSLRNEFRWVLIVLVALTNLVICHNLVMYSGFRALPDLFYAKKWPYDWLLMEEPIIEEIRKARKIRIAFTHEKLPYFGYMHWNPTARYVSPFGPSSDPAFSSSQDLLQIFPVSGLYMYGFMPIKIPGKATPGLTYLGLVRAIGREALFASGNGIEKRYPRESDYVLLATTFVPLSEGGCRVLFAQDPVGLRLEDNLTFAYELRKGDHIIFERAPNRDPAFQLVLDRNPYEEGLLLTTIVHSAWSGKEVARTTYPLSGQGMWLPEGGDY